MIRRFPAHAALACGAVALFTGCQRDEVVEYTTPKETFPAVSNIQQQLREAHASLGIPGHHGGGHAHPHGDGAQAHGHGATAPSLKFIAPDGWEEHALGTMRKASFIVRGESDDLVDISVMSFPGDTGGVHANVNRWREQIGLPPLPSAELSQQIDDLTINDNAYLMVDISGAPAAEGQKPQRIIGAILPLGLETWFFKMMGEQELTAAQHEPFLRFLETVEYEP